jgi:hypothetical protein
MNKNTKTEAAPVQAGHTPGMWTCNTRQMGDDDETRILDSEGNVIASIVHERGYPESISNGHLLAAAPALLDALQWLLSWSENQATPTTLYIEPLRQARAAIAQAKGETLSVPTDLERLKMTGKPLHQEGADL